MIQLNQNEQATKMGNWVNKRLDKYELILGLLFVIVMILKVSTNSPVNLIITFILMILAVLYFFNAFAELEIENFGGFEVFIYKLASWGCSVALIGILYRLQNWPGDNFILLIGSFATVFGLISMVIIKNKKLDLDIFNSRWILRLLLISIIGFALNFTTKDSLIKAKIINKVEQTNTK